MSDRTISQSPQTFRTTSRRGYGGGISKPDMDVSTAGSWWSTWIMLSGRSYYGIKYWGGLGPGLDF